MPQTRNIIRHELALDASIPFLEGLAPGDTLRLIASAITLTGTFDTGGMVLEFYTSTFTALPGAQIMSKGTTGGNGANAKDQTTITLSEGTFDGLNGETGQQGGRGTDGGLVKVFAEVVNNLSVDISGGNGGQGGIGGHGGNGRTKSDPPTAAEHVFERGAAGNGGNGGKGGQGGNGGTVILRTVNPTPPPNVTLSAGKGAPGGAGNTAGKPGPNVTSSPTVFVFGGRKGTDGIRGEPGSSGSDGRVDQTTLSFNEFWSTIASESFATEWAKYRHAVGEYFFRRWIPSVDGRDQFIGLAVNEFEAASRINPSQIESKFRLEQLQNGLNPLGLPRNLDIVPDFDTYITNLNILATIFTTFEQIANTFVFASSTFEEFSEIFDAQSRETQIRLKEANDDRDASESNKTNISDALGELEKMMASVQKQIETEQEAMKHKPGGILDTVKKVVEVAGAVAAVMSAVPTGGASLLVLAPEVVTFTKTIYDNGGEIFQSIIDKEQSDSLDKAKKEYKAVDGDLSKIQDTSKKIGNMVDIITKLRAVKSPDTSKLMELVQKGAELAYEHLLKKQELQMAQLRIDSLERKIASEENLKKFYEKANAQGQTDSANTRETGLKVLEAVRSRVDTLLAFAFNAQRSIEIYLLTDQRQAISYDIGRVHPDLEAEYVRTGKNVTSLLNAYQISFIPILKAEELQDTWLRFFQRLNQRDTIRMSYDDSETLNAFQSTHILSFDIDLNSDVNSVLKKRFKAKIQTVGIAFIGAKGRGDQVSCIVEHGGLYWERDIDGVVKPTVMVARHDIKAAQVTSLQINGFDSDPQSPASEARRSNLWAMPVGGMYTLRVTNEEISANLVNFDGLTSIEIWIRYQFLE